MVAIRTMPLIYRQKNELLRAGGGGDEHGILASKGGALNVPQFGI
jgi:hypothetical protein